MHVQASPLHWPEGWKRTPAHARKGAKFSSKAAGAYGTYSREVTISVATSRVLSEMRAMRVHEDDMVISTNLRLRLDGLPRSNQPAPEDPGAAVYWRVDGEDRCIGVDIYDRVEDNLAAIAATLGSMRTIERHGGAQVLARVFKGFTALPSPGEASVDWRRTLGVPECQSLYIAHKAYRLLVSAHHPDRGGNPDEFRRVQRAYELAKAELS